MPVLDFQIIGGGLIGLSTAYALLERGANVRILEAREDIALETSFANAGMVHASLADPWNEPGIGRQLARAMFNKHAAMKLRPSALPSLIGWGRKFLQASTPQRHRRATLGNYKLAVFSMQVLARWREDLSIKDDYQSGGLLKIFRHDKNFQKAKALTDMLAAQGLRAQNIDAQQAVDIEPALGPIADKITGGLYYPDDYKADAYQYCCALKHAITQLGGTIETNVKFQTFVQENGLVIGVQTDKGERRAGLTILAAGARTYQLLKPLGIKLPVRPIKGYSLTFRNISGPKIPVVDDSLHTAITPLGRNIRIAGTAEITGFNPAMPRVRIQTMLKMLQNIYPQIAQGLQISDGTAWHGFRPVSADGMPYIGKAAPGLAINAGQGHMGWTLSAGSGALLADMLLGQTPKIPVRPFEIAR
ncbi:MAG: FAD-dependent oxidoreductase [Robiginitomaculum sp.]